jgi:hypothetical protein
MILILTVFSVHVSKECGDTSTRHLQLTNKLYVYLLTCFNPVLFLVQFSIAACIYFKRVFLLFLRTPRGIIVGTGTRPLVCCFSSHSLISIVPSFVASSSFIGTIYMAVGRKHEQIVSIISYIMNTLFFIAIYDDQTDFES